MNKFITDIRKENVDLIIFLIAGILSLVKAGISSSLIGTVVNLFAGIIFISWYISSSQKRKFRRRETNDE